MSLFRGMDISVSGLRAGRTRMEVIAQNVANAESVDATGEPYHRKEVALLAAPMRSPGLTGTVKGGGVRVLAVREDPSELQQVYDPGNPRADAEGYVQMPNVSVPLEMVDMAAASRAYEANASALKTGRDMVRRTLDILR